MFTMCKQTCNKCYLTFTDFANLLSSCQVLIARFLEVHRGRLEVSKGFRNLQLIISMKSMVDSRIMSENLIIKLREVRWFYVCETKRLDKLISTVQTQMIAPFLLETSRNSFPNRKVLDQNAQRHAVQRLLPGSHQITCIDGQMGLFWDKI